MQLITCFYLIYIIAIFLVSISESFELFSMLGGSAVAAAGAGIYNLYNYYSRCTIQEPGLLNEKLHYNLVGQHIVVNNVLGAVNSHTSNGDPPHALSLVFAGSTGTGKNYVAQLIAESVHKEGLKSKHVHLFSGRYHFPLHSEVYQYQRDLQNWVKGNVSKCPHSIFIFDEIDKVPPKILDSIKHFLDYSAVYNGVSYTHAIFIFLTNLGGLQINKRYRQLRESGVVREEMNYMDFEKDLRQVLFDSGEGMFQDSDAIRNHVISQYLPFLPLEKAHVQSCIKKEMAKRSMRATADRVEMILKNIDFHHDMWSVSGCKRVSDHVSTMYYS